MCNYVFPTACFHLYLSKITTAPRKSIVSNFSEEKKLGYFYSIAIIPLIQPLLHMRSGLYLLQIGQCESSHGVESVNHPIGQMVRA